MAELAQSAKKSIFLESVFHWPDFVKLSGSCPTAAPVEDFTGECFKNERRKIFKLINVLVTYK